MNQDACSYPETAARVARAAEAAGFESLWCGEHVVLPDPQAPPSPMAPRDRILDPVVALTFLAAHTSRAAARHRHHHPARSAIPWSSRRSWPASTCSRAAACSSASAWAISSPSSAPSARPSRRAAPSPTSTSRRCRRSGARSSPPTRAASPRSPTCRRIPQPVQRPLAARRRGRALARRLPPRGRARRMAGMASASTPRARRRRSRGLREAAKQVERPAALGPLEISLTPRGWGLERATRSGVRRAGYSPPGGPRATRSGRRGARGLRRPLRRGSASARCDVAADLSPRRRSPARQCADPRAPARRPGPAAHLSPHRARPEDRPAARPPR